MDRDKLESVQHYRAGQDALRSEKYDELPRYGLGQTYMAMKRYQAAIVAFHKCRDVLHATAVADTTDDARRQRRIDDQLQELDRSQCGNIAFVLAAA